jgi:polysaccharide export outer membrane protein
VIVTDVNSRFVSIMGGVKQNTRVPLTRNLRVLEAIAAAGGFSTFADRSDVRIVRRGDDGTEQEYRFDYEDYIRGYAPGTNIVLQPGDTIIVPE